MGAASRSERFEANRPKGGSWAEITVGSLSHVERLQGADSPAAAGACTGSRKHQTQKAPLRVPFGTRAKISGNEMARLKNKGKPVPRRQAERHLPTLPCGGKQGIFRARRRKFPSHRGQSPLWKNPTTAHRGGIFGRGGQFRSQAPAKGW